MEFSTNDWFKLAYQERILGLFFEHLQFRARNSIHNRHWKTYIPNEWKQKLSSLTDEEHSLNLQAFVRQLVRCEIVNVLQVGLTNAQVAHTNWNHNFNTILPISWYKTQVAKLLKSLATVRKTKSSRVQFLQTRISAARAQIEASPGMKNLPFSRNITDLRINLGSRTKLLDWFAARRRVPTKRVVNTILPMIRGKHIGKLLEASKDNARLRSLLNEYERKIPVLVRNLRLHGGNIGRWSAIALQHIFWHENKVRKWDSDMSNFKPSFGG